MTPDEARLRELERDIVFVRATLRSEERRAFKRILDALSAERERGDRAERAAKILRLKGTPGHLHVENCTVIDCETGKPAKPWSATQKAEGAISTPATTDDFPPPR